MRAEPVQTEESHVLVDGSRIHFLRAGTGPPLILLHGLVGSLRNWRFNIRSLAEKATVYALDLPNMGESDRLTGLDASLEVTSDRIAALMDALELDQADIVGHSHGGAVALTLAARHPSRVSRLILFAPANPFCDQGLPLIRFYTSRTGRLFARTIPVLPRWVKALALGRMYGDRSRVPTDALDGYIAGLQVRGTVSHVLRILHRWSDDMSRLLRALPSLAQTPVLLIWGDRDRAVSVASALQLEKALSSSSLLIVPSAGHIPFEELPEVCNRAMLDFLARTGPDPVSQPQATLDCRLTSA